MSIESMMPSSHLILCHPLLLLPPITPFLAKPVFLSGIELVQRIRQDKAGAVGKCQTTKDLEGLDRSYSS